MITTLKIKQTQTSLKMRPEDGIRFKIPNRRETFFVISCDKFPQLFLEWDCIKDLVDSSLKQGSSKRSLDSQIGLGTALVVGGENSISLPCYILPHVWVSLIDSLYIYN